MTIEEAIRLSANKTAFSEDGSAQVFTLGDWPFWCPTAGDRRPRLGDSKRLEGDPMEEFLRGMTWIPDQPIDAVTLLGEVSNGDD